MVAGGSLVFARCTNIIVRRCERSGVLASRGGSIIIDETDSFIHENCTEGNSDKYELAVEYPSSKVQIISPLTKEFISKRSKGSGNWGATSDADVVNQIGN